MAYRFIPASIQYTVPAFTAIRHGRKRMAHRFSHYFLLLSCAFLLQACTKVITVNLNDASPQIVIEGNITNETGPYQVQITKTVNFSNTNSFPAVSGATVKITDITGAVTDTLAETAPGIYTTSSIQGVAGHSYQLFVLANGKTYASSSVMPQPVIFDSLTFLTTNLFGNLNINAVVNFKDPIGIKNYYSFTQYVNGRKLDVTIPFSDRLSDGKYISQQLFADSAYTSAGNTVKVQMNCLDKGAYDYFNTLAQVTGDNAQSVTPANPTGNISNNALGYFSAHTVQIKTAVAH